MTQSIYGLTYDFEQQNGNHIVFLGYYHKNIVSQDLAPIQVKMIQANPIPKLLPLEVEEIDFNVKLYYNFTGKRMLSQVLRDTKLTLSQYYELLYQLVSVVDKSKEYMLNEQNYILHPDFIFVDSAVTDVYVTYLPLVKVEEMPVLTNQLKQLVIDLVGHINELQGDGVQQLIQYFNESPCNVSELKKKLAHYKSTASNHVQQNAVRPTPTPVPQPQPTIQELPKPVRTEEKKSPSKKQKKSPAQEVAPSSKQKSVTPKAKSKEVTLQAVGTEEEPKKPKPLVIGLIMVLALLGIWKLYEMMPSEGMLFICSGLSLLAFTMVYFFFYVRVPKRVEQVDVTEQPVTSKPNAVRKKKKAAPIEPVQSPAKVEAPPIPKEDVLQTQQAATSEKEYFASLRDQTTLLHEAGETVVLGHDDQELQQNGPLLEVERNGTVERIYIRQNPFVIGRNPATVQYVEETTGVSRMHIEFVTNEEKVLVKDLGSKNGSKLNHEAMVPYKPYLLSDGDQIVIGKVSYTYKRI
ncbi:DUF6382 domain-containing protein [Alkalihalobacterium alkalicellulosilyticum]|uniref:DUF6382 domain-containing protein n=1 Tax=Alkalihalobacterium alkalicellulosilyticum TaxID=1912214 RepID=UPI0009979373|nr:DUF6382 domain-containing protein [Bacillus alkalicellulosilyticus]